jgi:hypothetical protein
MAALSKARVAAVGGGSAVALFLLTRQWDAWLRRHHDHEEEVERSDGEGTLTLGSSRPRTAGQLARGFASCIAFLAAADLLLCRRMRDDNSRYFLLHTLANAIISLSSAADMARTLHDPIGSGIGHCNVLPTYMIPSLFAYHLSVFKNVPLDEWQHHLLFGIGLAGPQLRYCVGPLQNAVGFFICGLPGGIDYAMLAAVKEGLLASRDEKVWNARIQVPADDDPTSPPLAPPLFPPPPRSPSVRPSRCPHDLVARLSAQVWMRSPGILLASYAMFLTSKYAHARGPSKVLPYLLFLLASFNGQYYMQKVVANTAFKVNGQGAC